MCDQIEFSDVILINKADLVTKTQLDNIISVIKKLNPDVDVHVTVNSNIDLKKILNTHKFDFEKAVTAPGWLKSLKEEVKPETIEYGISSFIYRARKPFHPERLFNLFTDSFFVQEDEMEIEEEGEGAEENKMEAEKEEENDEEENENEEVKSEKPSLRAMPIEEKSKLFKELLQNKKSGPFANVLRSKGFIWIAGRDTVHGEWSQAGMVASLNCGGPWFCEVPKENWPEEAVESILKDFDPVTKSDRRQEIVFIGQIAKEIEKITKTLDECLVKDDEKDEEFVDPWGMWPDAQAWDNQIDDEHEGHGHN